MNEPELASGDSGEFGVEEQAADRDPHAPPDTDEHPADRDPHAPPDTEGHPAIGALSEDHQWRWDGEHWQPEHPAAVATEEHTGGHVSADGQWLWDGTKWEPVR
jgi:hypothetical protein